MKTQSLTFILCNLILYSVSSTLMADLKDAENAEEKARKIFADRYLEFTGDKNVMGKAKDVQGKVQLTGNKTRFDNDDGVSYRSDLTYHDLAFASPDETAAKKNGNSKDPKAQAQAVRDLLPFVSPHGGLSEAGGSSNLERTMYSKFDELSKKDADEAEERRKAEEKGIKQKGVYRVETREVFEDPNAKAQAAAAAAKEPKPAQEEGKKEKEKDKVERVELLGDVKDAVAKVGTDSAETVIQAAKYSEFKDDPNALPNSTMLYDAAGRATNALWNSTLANLYQRRIFKGLQDPGFFDAPKLTEDNPDCAGWEKDALKKLAEIKDPKDKERVQKDFELMKKGCNQMSKMPYNAVNPGYEPLPNDPKTEILKEREAAKEDAFSRDLRNQLEVLSSAGKNVKELNTNWEYGENDEKVEVNIGVDETAKLSVAEQLDEYNKQLDLAKEGFAGVKERASQLQIDENDLDGFKIQPGSRSVMDINKAQAQAFDEYGVDAGKLVDPQAARSYEELIPNVKK